MFELSLGLPKHLTKDKIKYKFPSLLFKFSLKYCQLSLVKKKDHNVKFCLACSLCLEHSSGYPCVQAWLKLRCHHTTQYYLTSSEIYFHLFTKHLLLTFCKQHYPIRCRFFLPVEWLCTSAEKNRQEKQERCVRNKRTDDTLSKTMYQEKIIPLSPTFILEIPIFLWLQDKIWTEANSETARIRKAKKLNKSSTFSSIC